MRVGLIVVVIVAVLDCLGEEVRLIEWTAAVGLYRISSSLFQKGTSLACPIACSGVVYCCFQQAKTSHNSGNWASSENGHCRTK